MRLWRWVQRNSLWLVGLGLMLASSGLDGVYMALWMPAGWAWLGFVLNTTADVCNPVLTYWYGRLQQDRSSRKRVLSRVLLGAEAVAVGYSWLFGWRRLRTVLQTVEVNDWQWVAPVAAGFIPLLLAFIGYAQSLLSGRIDTITDVKREKSVETASYETETAYYCEQCEREFGSQQALNRHTGWHTVRNNGHKVAEREVG